jgi:hypothetical protein
VCEVYEVYEEGNQAHTGVRSHRSQRVCLVPVDLVSNGNGSGSEGMMLILRDLRKTPSGWAAVRVFLSVKSASWRV